MTHTSNGRAQPATPWTTYEAAPADREQIRAHLNLYALLQNLDELVRYDEQAAEIVDGWKVTIQFSVRRGPSAFLEFCEGECTHRRACRRSADVSSTSLRHGI